MVHSGASASIPTAYRHEAVLAMLEAATEGNRHLDDSVVIAATDGEMMDWWDEAAQQHVIKAGDGSRVNVTPVTTSLDAALALAERLGLDVLTITNEAVEGLAVSGWPSSLRTLVPELARHACIAILKAAA